jgi:hypothetical protein
MHTARDWLRLCRHTYPRGMSQHCPPGVAVLRKKCVSGRDIYHTTGLELSCMGSLYEKQCCPCAMYENPSEIALKKVRKIGTFSRCTK